MPHNKNLKRKAEEDLEVSRFITQWTDPYPTPDFTLWRPTKTRRTNKALGLLYIPDPPPNTPVPATFKTRKASIRAKGRFRAPSYDDDDGFRPTPAQKSWMKKKPSLEAKYRRNHKLKKDFANTATPLKAALAEIAKRSLEKLEEDEQWHEQGENVLSYYLCVQELEKRRDAKIKDIETRKKLRTTQIGGWYEYDKVVREGEYSV